MTTRTRVFQTPLATVETLESAGARDTARPKGFSAEFQVCLPYSGLFIWHVGRDDVVGDANQVLFVAGGEPFTLSEPAPHGYGELIVTPGLPLLGDLARRDQAHPASHPPFVRPSPRARPPRPTLPPRVLPATTHR